MLHTLSSSLHQEAIVLPFELPATFTDHHQVVAVLTGGTENLFVRLLRQGQITLSEPVYILASGQSNSLAASLEILAFIRQHDGVGYILQSPEDLNRMLPSASSLTFVPSEDVLKHAESMRLGVIGFPSDWLIASQADYEMVLRRMNIELVDIPIEEILSLGQLDGGIAGAEKIYERVKEIVGKYDLQGVTLRCFDLLTTVHNTGCLALSRLNDEGIPAACEGDIPTLLTMMICKKITGELCFQVNPARICTNGEMLFAHCTLPLGMTTSHEMTTHFESGIGVAIHGELPEGDYTLVKLSGDLSRLLAMDIQLTRCQYEPNLCRTQVWVQANEDLVHYFLTNPIANHHILIKGHHSAQFK